MVGVLLTFAAGVLAVAAVGVAARVGARRASLSARGNPTPAGVKHLAASVGELSDIGLHLPSATRTLGNRRRLGVLLGLH